VLPGHFNIKNCHTKPDEIASCDDLLRSNSYRFALWLFSVLILTGNAGSLISRFATQKGFSQNSFNICITNLNVADFLMGVYLSVIGGADLTFQGAYLWHDRAWRTSRACRLAGVLCLTSCEVSALVICLVTLDRLLVLRFPFSTLRFGRASATAACGAVWALGLGLAAVPLLPPASHWQFYSQTGICIPLPVTRHSFQGHAYSFAVIIMLNFVLFVLIAVGQMIIYSSVVKNSMSSEASTAREAKVARRLVTVVLSDFLCWFPIGLLGLLASRGHSIPSEVNVAIAIFVLPLNSTLNPFLYTFNVLLERRRKATEERLMAALRKQLADGHKV
jgi:hypothetical protein